MFNIMIDGLFGPRLILDEDVTFEKAESILLETAKIAKERGMNIVKNPRIVGTADITFTEKKIGRVQHGRWF